MKMAIKYSERKKQTRRQQTPFMVRLDTTRASLVIQKAKAEGVSIQQVLEKAINKEVCGYEEMAAT